MYTLLHKKIKGKPYSIRHYRGFPKLFLENQALLGFHEAKTGVECGSWASVGLCLHVCLGCVQGSGYRQALLFLSKPKESYNIRRIAWR